MPGPLSIDLRRRIVDKRADGCSVAEISEQFSVSVRSVHRYCKLQRDHGSICAKKLGKPRVSKLDAHRERIESWINKQPGLTLQELTIRCADELKLSIHHTTLLRALRKWGYSYKKNALRQRTKS